VVGWAKGALTHEHGVFPTWATNYYDSLRRVNWKSQGGDYASNVTKNSAGAFNEISMLRAGAWELAGTRPRIGRFGNLDRIRHHFSHLSRTRDALRKRLLAQ
jgi:hypothetical protein